MQFTYPYITVDLLRCTNGDLNGSSRVVHFYDEGTNPDSSAFVADPQNVQHKMLQEAKFVRLFAELIQPGYKDKITKFENDCWRPTNSSRGKMVTTILLETKFPRLLIQMVKTEEWSELRKPKELAEKTRVDYQIFWLCDCPKLRIPRSFAILKSLL